MPRKAAWHSRGYLPHFDSPIAVQHVTIHLADSLPADVVERMAVEINRLPEDQRDVERRRKVDAWLDSGHGCCMLREPAIAAMVQETLLHFDGDRYRILAWVVMPNHVHVLFQAMARWTMAQIVASWKEFTARRINDVKRNVGAGTNELVWHREYWDRYIRNEKHFQTVVAYIHDNPVKAGLAARAQDWPWSSAGTPLGTPIS